MNTVLEQQVVTIPGEAVDASTWEMVVCGTFTSSPGASNSMSDDEIAAAAAQSGSFDFLNRPKEDLYTLEDGQEV
ncbi:MAG: hypothetical protein K8R91_04475 [Phycisphaerae bacterium]|nr:hypothetical protein [Phycisphaerae bacterium]